MIHSLLRLPCIALFVVAALLPAAAPDAYTPAERRHWAFQPRSNPPLPSLSPEDRAWVKQPIDAFILARLRKEGLAPAPPAGRRTLIRRAFLDVTGLPPKPEEVERFVRDKSPAAWTRVVDDLLARPEYAERWAQHWLDVVRYAESDGFEYDYHRSDAWRYRDYVIDSFRADKPYDQFLREQLAGDEIDSSDQQMLVAASFHRLGAYRKNAGNQDAAYNRNEVLVEMTNVIGSGILGVTLGCARCHDHKFDPIRQKDYYRIQAFFSQTQFRDVPRYTPEQEAAWKAKTAAINAEVRPLKRQVKTATGAAKVELEAKIDALENTLPEPLPVLGTVADDPKQYVPVHVLFRGDAGNPGDQVGPRPLGVLLPDGAPEWSDQAPDPRLALAKWITDPANPLTARVLVNRIWQHHFGTGIVATPNDFGRMGSRPTHPELLDFLADRFVEGGFRMKPIHRMILLSSAYQQDFVPVKPALAAERDPDDKLLWGFPRHRLDAGELRDSMLFVSGKFNPQKGGPSVIVPIEPELTKLLYKPWQWVVNPDPKQFYRRSIYLFEKRNMRLPFMEVFDTPDRQLSCERREESTHAPQALELLNGTFSQEMAAAFADRVIEAVGPSHEKQVDRAYALALGRPPDPAERKAALQFLRDSPLREFTLAVFLLNDFLYVN